MDYRLEAELRARRDEIFAFAKRRRLIRLAESGRSIGLRARIANGAQMLSDRLADIAALVRGTERA